MIDQLTQILISKIRMQAYQVKYAPYMDDEPDEIKERLKDAAIRIDEACDELEDRLNLIFQRSALTPSSPNERWLDPSWPESGVEKWTK